MGINLEKDIISQGINKEALKYVAEKYNISQKDAKVVIRMYADYVFHLINSIDETKDLSTQNTRILLKGIGIIYIKKPFLFTNYYIFGKMKKETLEQIKKWMPGTFAYLQTRLDTYKDKLNTTDND